MEIWEGVYKRRNSLKWNGTGLDPSIQKDTEEYFNRGFNYKFKVVDLSETKLIAILTT